MKFILTFFLVISINIVSEDMTRVDVNFEGESRHYLIYKPNADIKTTSLVIGIHGYTGTASGFEKETTGGFNLSADKYNFIAVYPQGTYFYENKPFGRFLNNTYVSSWNDLTGSKTMTPDGETCAEDAPLYPQFSNCEGTDAGRCAWASCGNDIGFIKKIIDDLKEKYNLNKIYLVGMSNGGMMAHAFACEYPDLLSGVINVVGAPALGLGCEPSNPFNYIIYGGLKDDIVPPIDIISWDKYYYTPINDITDRWSELFECKQKKSSSYDEFDEINESVYFDCKNEVKIINLLNINQGHTWPGVNNSSAGNCRSSSQYDINFSECKQIVNKWGNDFLLERLFDHN